MAVGGDGARSSSAGPDLEAPAPVLAPTWPSATRSANSGGGFNAARKFGKEERRHGGERIDTGEVGQFEPTSHRPAKTEALFERDLHILLATGPDSIWAELMRHVVSANKG